MSTIISPLTLSTAKSGLLGYRPRELAGQSYAAVAVLLCEHPTPDGILSPHVLLIQRALHPNDPWSGHLAFPGGRREPSDQSALHTAIRETREEIGVDLAPVQLLGQLDPLSAKGARLPGLVIDAFVFEVPHQSSFSVDVSEVARVFWVPIPPLTRGERNTTIEVQRDGIRYRLPGYDVEQQVLWGMTYEMFQALARLSQWLA
jgi:8-oxo-dGTP pyrophosphatase MutT (NUDIX family)